jgi:hypothetical protein
MQTLDMEEIITDVSGPLEVLESYAAEQGWACDRPDDDELAIAVNGAWCDYQLRCVWRDEDCVLQLLCRLDMKVPEAKRPSIYETLGLINERLWMGHFELWSEDGSLTFRNAVYTDPDLGGLTPTHGELLVQAALAECERFYPVVQLVLWADKTPAEAIEAAMLETAGEA